MWHRGRVVTHTLITYLINTHKDLHLAFAYSRTTALILGEGNNGFKKTALPWTQTKTLVNHLPFLSFDTLKIVIKDCLDLAIAHPGEQTPRVDPEGYHQVRHLEHAG